MTELVTTPRRSQPAFGRACARLRALQPEHPRVYAVAAMAEQGKRRWWRLSDGAREGRIELMYRRHAAEMISADIAAEVVATALIHAVVGRVVALLVAEGRAWDPGLENLWIHTDNDGGIDWAAWWTPRFGCWTVTGSPASPAWSPCRARRPCTSGSRIAANLRWRSSRRAWRTAPD